MRVRPFGDRALLLECGGTAEVRAAYAEALRRREAGELALHRHRPGGPDPAPRRPRRPRAQVTRGLDELALPSSPTSEEGELVELPVTYDGPDLESVAEHSGLDRRRGGAAAPGQRVRGGVLRFRPRLRLPDRAARGAEVPRLDEPRSKVPAGSVGLAGTFTGVYPRSSPGGWQLIARTDARPVGRRARPAGAAGARAPGCGSPMAPEMAEPRSLEVTDAGLQVTVQDLGRPGPGPPRRPALRRPRRAGAPPGQPPRGQPGVGGHAGVPRRPGRVPDAERCTVAVTGAQVPVTRRRPRPRLGQRRRGAGRSPGRGG